MPLGFAQFLTVEIILFENCYLCVETTLLFHLPRQDRKIQSFLPILGLGGIGSRFFLPMGTTKPPPSGSGKLVWFDRKPVKIGQIQISNSRWQFNQFPPVSRPVWPVNRSGLSGNRELNKKTNGKLTLFQNLNVCIICFSLNEPSNLLLYYFYITTMYNMFYIVYVYFCMHVFLTSNARKVY